MKQACPHDFERGQRDGSADWLSSLSVLVAAMLDHKTEEPSLAEAVACAEERNCLVTDDPPESPRVLESRLADYSIREIADE